MDRMEAEDFSLFGLLGRSWHLDAAVVDVMFDANVGAAAFVLADGSIAIAKIKDSEPAAKRIRISAEDGRSSILPRTKPLPPMVRFPVQEGQPAAVTAYGKHGFVMGDASGALISATIGGERTPFAGPSLDAPVTLIDQAGETGRVACAANGDRVTLIDRESAGSGTLDHGSTITALRFSPRGDLLAVGEQDAITLWRIEEQASAVVTIPTPGRPLTLAWAPDQTRLAVGFETGGAALLSVGDHVVTSFTEYPAAVRSIAWNPNGDVMATSGAFRIIAWPMDTVKTNGTSPPPTSLETGKPSLVAVEAIAAHPKRPLIAAGYENGMLIIAELGKRDELLIKAEGDGAITGVVWSKDGSYLALGSERGLAALIELPAQLFK